LWKLLKFAIAVDPHVRPKAVCKPQYGDQPRAVVQHYLNFKL